MNLSACCGASTFFEKRSDLPHVYDDDYHLEIMFEICSKCGKILGLDSNSSNSHSSSS